MSDKGKFYMTTAIAYTSGKPHIGNTYEIVLADAIARYKRLEGYDVYFQTGTDEHGQKIQEKAEKAGITPKEYVDNVAGEVKRIWDLMNTSYDNFVRTTDADHEKQVQKIFKKLYDQGDIYKGSYEGLYCTPCESFWTESQLVDGKCPDCGREVKPAGEVKRIWDLMNTSYDNFVRTTDADHEKQVQKIFKKLYDQGDIYKGSYEGLYCTPCESFWTESQLVDGKCPDCGREVKPAKEEAYFFKMSKYADRLIEHINTHPEFIQPVSRKNEMMNNFLLPGLQDLCVSRTSFSWGIPVDFDPKHVVYVWLDALTNYITKIGYDADGNSSDLFKKNWPADLHLIGKDIIRFHTIYWPIFLMALDLPLPKQVFGHPWLLQGGDKMSKSKGNVIYADDMVDLFGVDATRYFVLHEMPFENDGVITWELVVERFNSDLANILGNLVNRTVSMSNKYFSGVVRSTGVTEEVDEDLKAVVTGARDRVAQKMKNLRVADAISEVFGVFRRCNKYIDETAPWVLAKDEAKSDRLAEVLYNLAESITGGASLLYSFLPETAEKIVAQLHTQLRGFEELNQFGLYENGTKVTETPEILFARLDAKDVMPKVEAIREAQKKEFEAEQKALGEEAPAEEKAEDVIDIEAKEEITYDDFTKLQFQVGEIISCEAVEKSKKLLCSQVRVGSEVKQIVSGIRKYYTPEEMVGKKVMVLVNLKPAKLAGVLSEGMLLCAEDAEGNLALMTPEKPMPAGAEIC